MLKVVQCWDDGVINDIRLTDLLRRWGAKATFNLNPGLHFRRAGRQPLGRTGLQRLELPGIPARQGGPQGDEGDLLRIPGRVALLPP